MVETAIFCSIVPTPTGGHTQTMWTRQGGGGVSKLSMLVHKGGGGVNRMVHVDFFSGLEYLFSNNYLKNDNLHHIYPKNCEKNIFLKNNLWIINL